MAPQRGWQSTRAMPRRIPKRASPSRGRPTCLPNGIEGEHSGSPLLVRSSDRPLCLRPEVAKTHLQVVSSYPPTWAAKQPRYVDPRPQACVTKCRGRPTCLPGEGLTPETRNTRLHVGRHVLGQSSGRGLVPRRQRPEGANRWSLWRSSGTEGA